MVRLKRKNEESVDNTVRQKNEEEKSASSLEAESTGAFRDERVEPADTADSQNQESNRDYSENREYTMKPMNFS